MITCVFEMIKQAEIMILGQSGCNKTDYATTIAANSTAKRRRNTLKSKMTSAKSSKTRRKLVSLENMNRLRYNESKHIKLTSCLANGRTRKQQNGFKMTQNVFLKPRLSKLEPACIWSIPMLTFALLNIISHLENPKMGANQDVGSTMISQQNSGKL